MDSLTTDTAMDLFAGEMPMDLLAGDTPMGDFAAERAMDLLAAEVAKDLLAADTAQDVLAAKTARDVLDAEMAGDVLVVKTVRVLPLPSDAAKEYLEHVLSCAPISRHRPIPKVRPVAIPLAHPSSVASPSLREGNLLLLAIPRRPLTTCISPAEIASNRETAELEAELAGYSYQDWMRMIDRFYDENRRSLSPQAGRTTGTGDSTMNSALVATMESGETAIGDAHTKPFHDSTESRIGQGSTTTGIGANAAANASCGINVPGPRGLMTRLVEWIFPDHWGATVDPGEATIGQEMHGNPPGTPNIATSKIGGFGLSKKSMHDEMREEEEAGENFDGDLGSYESNSKGVEKMLSKLKQASRGPNKHADGSPVAKNATGQTKAGLSHATHMQATTAKASSSAQEKNKTSHGAGVAAKSNPHEQGPAKPGMGNQGVSTNQKKCSGQQHAHSSQSQAETFGSHDLATQKQPVGGDAVAKKKGTVQTGPSQPAQGPASVLEGNLANENETNDPRVLPESAVGIQTKKRVHCEIQYGDIRDVGTNTDPSTTKRQRTSTGTDNVNTSQCAVRFAPGDENPGSGQVNSESIEADPTASAALPRTRPTELELLRKFTFAAPEICDTRERRVKTRAQIMKEKVAPVGKNEKKKKKGGS